MWWFALIADTRPLKDSMLWPEPRIASEERLGRIPGSIRIIAIAWHLFVFSVLFSYGSGPAFADHDDETVEEHLIKAAFVYNFMKFVEWPSSTSDGGPSLSICILGTGPMREALLSLSGKKIGDRTLTVDTCMDMRELRECDVLFITISEKGRLNKILDAIRGASILTISDMDHFVVRGGLIGMITENKRIRFAINLRSARSASLRISSRLLKLASKVVQ